MRRKGAKQAVDRKIVQPKFSINHLLPCSISRMNLSLFVGLRSSFIYSTVIVFFFHSLFFVIDWLSPSCKVSFILSCFSLCLLVCIESAVVSVGEKRSFPCLLWIMNHNCTRECNCETNRWRSERRDSKWISGFIELKSSIWFRFMSLTFSYSSSIRFSSDWVYS